MPSESANDIVMLVEPDWIHGAASQHVFPSCQEHECLASCSCRPELLYQQIVYEEDGSQFVISFYWHWRR